MTRRVLLAVALKTWALYFALNGLSLVLVAVSKMNDKADMGTAGDWYGAWYGRTLVSGVIYIVAGGALLWKGGRLANALLPETREGRGFLGAGAATTGVTALVLASTVLAGLLIYPTPQQYLGFAQDLDGPERRTAVVACVLGALLALGPRAAAALRRRRAVK